jgi:hypothetical protein
MRGRENEGIDVLQELYERVRQASGANRELDVAISIALFGGEEEAKPLTSSIDASASAVEHFFPGQWGEFLEEAIVDETDETGERTLPLDIIAALLSALITSSALDPPRAEAAINAERAYSKQCSD